MCGLLVGNNGGKIGLPSAELSKCRNPGMPCSAGDPDRDALLRAEEATSANISSDCKRLEPSPYRGYSVQEYCGNLCVASGELVGPAGDMLRSPGDTNPFRGCSNKPVGRCCGYKCIGPIGCGWPWKPVIWVRPGCSMGRSLNCGGTEGAAR